MQFRTIVAAFLLDRSQASTSLRDRAIAAGMTDILPLEPDNRKALGFHEPGREIVGGTWGAFGMAWAIVDDIKEWECVQIYTSMDSYFDALVAVKAVGSMDDDPTLPFIETFRDACLRLYPSAAFLDTRSHYGDPRWEDKQGNRDWVCAQARRAAAYDISALADEHYSIMYLDEVLSRQWDSNSPSDERDCVALPRGRLMFAGTGATRMA